MNKYFPSEFEQKWVDKWQEEKLFQNTYGQEDVMPDNKMYLLFAFAYPSGLGLHVGHVESKTALDILARYYRSIGKKVFFPVGWDAFGLPAENYAVKTGIHPEKTTTSAINTFRRQIKRIGISYDWATEIATCHEGYCKWSQWLFLELYKKGLAYKGKAPVNWCPSCQTVLANEQVIAMAKDKSQNSISSQVCERCETEVVQKDMEQWFFKITDYKDELITGLNQVDWPKTTIAQQRNWIGKKEGINIIYPVVSELSGVSTELSKSIDTVSCFTTRPDTNFGATFIVLSPEHQIVQKIIKGDYGSQISKEMQKKVRNYYELSMKKTEEERKMEGQKKTGVFTGLYAKNGLNNSIIPIWVSDFVLSGFGTGAVVGVPGHDVRDFQFAKIFDIPILRVVSENGKTGPITKESEVQEEAGVMINSGFLDGMDIHKAKDKIMDYLVEKGMGKRVVMYNLRDWLISRQRYWGAPIPIVYDPQGKPHVIEKKHLPWKLPDDVDFKPTGESPLRYSKEFKARVETLYGKGWTPEYDTMDTFVDSSWYYFRFCDPRNENEFAKKENIKKWLPVDFYMIGPEHIVLHLLYSRFFTKFLRDEGYIGFSEPFTKMRHQGMILGPDNHKMSKSKGNVINPDEIINEYGADTLRMYEMFLGPIDADKPWSQSGVQGLYRFLKRIWNLFQNELETGKDQKQVDISVSLNKTIKKVGEDIEALKFNTAIASMMQLLNEIEAQLRVNELTSSDKQQEAHTNTLTREPVNLRTVLTKDDGKKILKILSPFAPFITEEIWRGIFGEKQSIHLSVWPKAQECEKGDAILTIPVQVSGKFRGTISVQNSKCKEQEYIIAEALKQESIKKYVDNKKFKAIYVEGKILNLALIV